MKTLFVRYDSRCGLCAEVRDWLRIQPAYVDLQLVESESDEARRLFQGLPDGDLAVLSDDSHVWLGDNAFIMCLWALRAYRRWAQRWRLQCCVPWHGTHGKPSLVIGRIFPASWA